jgi:hypothetical protein
MIIRTSTAGLAIAFIVMGVFGLASGNLTGFMVGVAFISLGWWRLKYEATQRRRFEQYIKSLEMK